MAEDLELREPPGVAALRRRAWIPYAIIAVGGLMGLVGVASGGMFAWLGLGYGGLGVALRSLQARRIRAGVGSAYLQAAAVALEAGDTARARALLARVPPRSFSYLERSQRALLGRCDLAEGDLPGARAHADAALAVRPGLLDRTEAAQAAEGVRALSAMLAARTGDAERARSEAAAVEASALATPDAIRLAAMARGVVLEREGRLDALAAHLEAERELLAGAVEEGERRLVRTWRRAIGAPGRSVYRTAAPSDEEAPPPEEGAGEIAPERARSHGTRRRRRDAPGSDVRFGDGRPLVRFWVRLIAIAGVAFLVAWALAFGMVTTAGPVPGAPSVLLLLGAVVLGAALWLRWRVRRARARTAELLAALRAMSRGDYEAARLIAGRAVGDVPYIACQAELALSVAAFHLGDPERALAHARRGLGHLRIQALRAALHESVYTGLVGAEALALAGLGRVREAEDALAAIPDVPLGDRTRFPAGLLLRLASGDDAAVREEVRRVPLGVGGRVELLARIARAVVDPASVGAVDRAWAREDASRPASRAFVQRYAPGLLARFEAEESTSDEVERSDEPAGARAGADEVERSDEPAGARAGAGEDERDDDAMAEVEAGREAEPVASKRHATPSSSRR